MRLLVLSLVVFFISASAFALENKFSLGGGIHANFPIVDADLGDGVDEEVSASLVAGGKATIKLSEYWSLRTGLFIQEKSAGYDINTGLLKGTLRVKVISAAVPVTAQYQVNEKFGIFGGYSADFKINDYCEPDGDFDTCTLNKEADSVVHNAILGISITPAKLWDIDISYQQGLTEFYYKTKVNSLTVMALYNFQ